MRMEKFINSAEEQAANIKTNGMSANLYNMEIRLNDKIIDLNSSVNFCKYLIQVFSCTH